MSFKIHCPKCKKALAIPANSSAKKGKCPFCRHSFAVVPPLESSTRDDQPRVAHVPANHQPNAESLPPPGVRPAENETAAVVVAAGQPRRPLQPPNREQPALPPPRSDSTIADAQVRRYWLLVNDVPRGPYTTEEIRSQLAAGDLSLDSQACRAGESVWQALSQLKDFSSTVSQTSSGVPAAAGSGMQAPKSAKDSVAGAFGAILVALGVMIVAALKKAPVGLVAGRAASVAHKQGYSWAEIWGVIFWAGVGLMIAASLFSWSIRGFKKLLALLGAPATPQTLSNTTADSVAVGAAPQQTPDRGAEWWISNNGQLSGPFSTAVIRTGAMAGRFRADTLICQAGDVNWLPMSAWLKPPLTKSLGDPI